MERLRVEPHGEVRKRRRRNKEGRREPSDSGGKPEAGSVQRPKKKSVSMSPWKCGYFEMNQFHEVVGIRFRKHSE